jgi:hypothetical protein
MDLRRMISDHTWHDDDIMSAIETMYPDPLKRKEFINVRWFNDDGNWCTLLTESLGRGYRRTLPLKICLHHIIYIVI